MTDSISNAKSWAEFLSQIREARHSMGDPSITWFRGQAKHDLRTSKRLLAESAARDTPDLPRADCLLRAWIGSGEKLIVRRSSGRFVGVTLRAVRQFGL